MSRGYRIYLSEDYSRIDMSDVYLVYLAFSLFGERIFPVD